MALTQMSKRRKASVIEHPEFNADNLLNNVKQKLGLRSDAALCRIIGLQPSVISKVRHRVIPISSQLLLALHEETNISIRDLRYLGGDFRVHTGPSAAVVSPPSRGAAL